jgi:membrane associated rhomboid family serine protease
MSTQFNSSLPIILGQKRNNDLQFIHFLKVKRGIKFLIEGFKSIPPITRYITFICLGIFSIQLVLMGFSIDHRLYFELYSMNSPKFYPHQIFTSSFAHDDVSHIVFNLVYFCLLGSICEKLIRKHYIRLIIFTIFIDTSFWMLLDPVGGVLGLSGVISAILVVLLLSRNSLPILLNFTIKLLCLVFILADVILVMMGILDIKFDEKTRTALLHCVGFSAGIMYMTIYVFYHRFKESRFYPYFLVKKLKLIGGKIKLKMIQLIKRRIAKIRAFFTRKNLISKVKTATFVLIAINVSIHVLHEVIFANFGFKLNDFLSSYSFFNDNFHVFSILTANLAHIDWDHLFWNMLFFVLVGFAVESRLGTKKYLLIILVSGLFSSFIFHSHDVFVQQEIATILKQNNIKDSDVQLTKNFEVDTKNSAIFKKVKGIKAYDISEKIRFGKGCSKGFSGCLFGAMMAYLIIFHYKRLLLNLIILLQIALNINSLVENDFFYSTTQLVHLGGALVGLVFVVLTFYLDKRRKFELASPLPYRIG